MPYSGTTSFLMTRDDVIKAALRALEIYGPADTIPTEDITNCTEAMNILLKAWGGQGLVLWRTEQVSFALTAGVNSYAIGPTAGAPGFATDLPLRVSDAYLRVSNVDTKVQVMSRYDYNAIDRKSTQGSPSQLFYDPQVPNGTLYVYPTPNGALTLSLSVQVPIQDAGASTDNPDIPQEWYQLLKWALASEIASEYGCPLAKIEYVEKKADFLRQQLTDFILRNYGELDDTTPVKGNKRIGRA